jgi:ACS family D-galactonate transporter-like MFS transporter
MDHLTFAETAVGVRASSRRFIIMGMLFVTVVINYLDRANLPIAAPGITAEFHLTPIQLGMVFSAFGWFYTGMQLPGGWLVDRIRPGVLYPVTIFLWSLATLSMGLVSGLVVLIALRAAVGFTEAPSFLMNNRIATTWFGGRERATCVAVYSSAMFVGLAFLTPLLTWLRVAFGWQMVFLFTGVFGIAWAFAFALMYREPTRMRGVNQAEIDLIRGSGGIPDLTDRIGGRRLDNRRLDKKPGSLWQDLKIVLGRRKLWGVYFEHYETATISSFFLTWFPTYLVTYRHLDFIKAGFYGAIPFFGAFVGVLWSGALSDWLFRRGYSLSFARKAPLITGLVLSTTIFGANFVDSPALIIMFLSLAFFGDGMAKIHWALVSTTAPERLIGLASGIFNGVGGIAGVSGPIIIGFLLRGGNFALPLTFISWIAMAGVLSYIFVLGKLEQVVE